ncbi:MAG: hypothetical protein RLZZ200_934 [Pseudomonadota bacterium]
MADELRPILTLETVDRIRRAAVEGRVHVELSLDLGRTRVDVAPRQDGFSWQGRPYPLPERCRDRTAYAWTGREFEAIARFNGSLIKLVPTDWGPPTFEIDGIKMLPTARVSPWDDARDKVRLVQPNGKVVLDCCGGLGYFAAWCLAEGASRILSFEKNPDVIWLRSQNPWSPPAGGALELTPGSVLDHIGAIPTATVDAVLHDPPRFGIAGELYSADFHAELARVLRRGGRLFHYTGTPNKLTSGRDVPREVTQRLSRAGFRAAPQGDGVLATRR